MIRIILFQQRWVWMPTIIGWIFLLVFSPLLCMFGVRNIYYFLAQNEPVGAQILVIEEWLAPEELDEAVQTY